MLLQLFLLWFLSSVIRCSEINNFIKYVEYQIDSGFNCMGKYYKNKTVMNSEAKIFENQLQDHFDALNRKTWSQQYFVRTPIGDKSDIPVVLVGGEAPTGDMTYLFESLLPEFGKKAMTFTLAHRYYQGGEHINPTDHFNVTRDSRLLSSKQALADLAYFIEHVVVDEYKFTHLPIIMGCSYPGSLSIWFREKYPHLSMAAIALSGPIRAFDNFHQYLEVGEKAVKDLFPKCYPVLVSGKKNLVDDTAKNNGTEFAKKMNLCADTGFKDWQDIVTVGWVTVSMQFAIDLGQGGYTGEAKGLCNYLERVGPFEFLSNQLNTQGGGRCRDPAEVIKNRRRSPKAWESAYPDWFWQKCSEFGWFKTHSTDNLFNLFPLEEYHQVCKEDYGVDVDLLTTVLDETNAFYGGTNITQLTKLLILNGADDPWHAPSMYEYGNDYNGLVSKWIPKGHHCTFVNGGYTEEAKKIAKEALDTWMK